MNTNQTITFFAMLDRMKYIERWALMKNTERENLKEHSFDVAILVHALLSIRNSYFPSKEPKIKPEDGVLFALYHDAGEIITGDMPTPVKYFNQEMREQYKVVEEYAAEHLLSLLPPELYADYATYLQPAEKDSEKALELKKVIKQADILAAYIKCVIELKHGNKEFTSALEATKEKLKQYDSEEVQFFLERIMPSYQLSLDELNQPAEG